MSKYTTDSQIGRKLRGRLKIANPIPLSNVAGYGSTVTGQVVDPDLLTEILDQEEAFLDLCLGQFYKMPLKLTSTVTTNILNQIIDDLVVSHLLQIHFEGSNPMNSAADTGNMIGDLRRKGEILLAKITAGSNIFNSSQPAPMPSSFGMTEIQPLVLPEEIVLSRAQRPDLITRNYTETGMGQKSEKYRKKFNFFDMDDDRCCGGGRGAYNRDNEYF